MGIVYLARDLRLGRNVALKFLPPGLQDQPAALERFVAEAKAASALDHPNICTIYEIGEADSGETFIAMAFYEGETLKQKIARGPLDVSEACGYAFQMANGLGKAHEAGIVHRDMKPANVMITEDGIVKILDFGLARVEGQQLTRTGELLGTLDYMSPEQVEGGTADARSDVWSTGAMLYEMLTGARPFDGDNQAAVLYAVLHDEPEDISVSNETVPIEVIRLVGRCLQKDPSKRLRDARELLDGLEEHAPLRTRGIAGTIPPGTLKADGIAGRPSVPNGPAATLFWSRTSVRAASSVIAILLLALAIPVSRQALLRTFTPNSAIASSKPFVAVLPSSTGVAEDSILAEGLSHILTSELARFDSLSVLASAQIQEQPDRSLSAIHQLYNLDAILTVAIEHVGGDRVRITLVDPRTMEERGSVPLPMPDSAGFQAFQDSAPRALSSLVGARRRADVAPPRPLTDYRAFDYYTQGRAYLARHPETENLGYAIDLFDNALEYDEDYAPAHAGICEARFEQFRSTNDTSFVRLARPSCDAAIRLGPELVEVLVPVASVYHRTGDPDEAREILLDAITIDPLNANAHRWLARVADETGDVEGARLSYEEAIRLDPRQWEYHSDYAAFLVYHSDREGSIPYWREVRRVAPDNFMGDLGLSATFTWLDREDEAEELLLPLVEQRAHPRAFSNLGYLYFRAGRYSDGIRVLEEGLVHFEGDEWIWRWLAHNAHWASDPARAEEAWSKVVEICETVLSVNAHDIDCLSATAEAYAQLGERELSRQYLDLFLFEPQKWDFHVYDLGRTLEMLGSRSAALQRIGEAVARGWDMTTVGRDPWLEDLRNDAGYRAEVVERALSR